MIAAGLIARNAHAKGLKPKPWVKTSLAPGSRVVADYLKAAGLQDDLDALGYQLVGFGCATCIGNSGPLLPEISEAINANDLTVTSVLSGNRNFEGRISPDVKMNYLASPPLVIAYALAGTMDFDFETQPLGKDRDGNDVYLKDIWPTNEEVAAVVDGTVSREMFLKDYASVFEGDRRWKGLDVPEGELFAWDENSTYVRKQTFFDGMKATPDPVKDIHGARVLALLGDSVTTDHISPAGAFKASSPAGKYLTDRGVEPKNFNSYGSRRGNHEVMVRGTFGNIRLRNQLLASVGEEITPVATPTTSSTRSRPRSSKRLATISTMMCRSSCSQARNTVPAPPVTGPPRAPSCWVSKPSSPKASNASTVPTSSAWACCHCSSPKANRMRVSA